MPVTPIHTPPQSPHLAPARRALPLPRGLGQDIFERLAPNQSSRFGADTLRAAGVSVPRESFADHCLRELKYNVVLALFAVIPAILLGVTLLQYVVFHVACITVYDQLNKPPQQ